VMRDMSAEAYAERIETRLSAIARTQAMLNRPGGYIELAALVSEALLAHAAHEGDRVSIDGPRILLHGGTAEILGLTMHELATNAVEHGALSGLNGSITIGWRVDGKLLRVEWSETVKIDQGDLAPRTGLGKELIETILKLELGAMASLDILSTGVHCTIAIPLGPQLTVPDQARVAGTTGAK
jgi:two-component system CheB/CheR fusion protein